MVRATVDANIWVSALLNPGNARRITQELQFCKFELACSEELILELVHVLNRPKIAAIVDKITADNLIALIQKTALFVRINQIPTISRDPKDNVYLACAAAAHCDFLITGDKDLLVLKTHGQTKIITPVEFLSALSSRESAP